MNLEGAFQDYLPDGFENRTEEQKRNFWKSKTVLYGGGIVKIGTLSNKEIEERLSIPVSKFLAFGHNKTPKN